MLRPFVWPIHRGGCRRSRSDRFSFLLMIVTWSFALFLPAICAETAASGETKPYSVFKDTASPDGRYAVAWGLPKHPDIWAKLSEFERQHSAEQELNDE